MRDYMEFIEKRFYQSTEWNDDNFYPHVNSSVENLIDFAIPKGTSLKVSSQASPSSFTSYTLSNRGLANGSVAYLFSSHPLNNIQTSDKVSLQDIISGYRILNPLKALNNNNNDTNNTLNRKWFKNLGVSRNETLYYGRIFFPGNDLEAMHIRRLSPTSQFVIKGVSDTSPIKGGVLTFSFQKDNGRFSHEYLYSTYESLVGVRSLYNFGFDDKVLDPTNPSRLSAGLEVYMALQTKSPGMSTAIRYTTESTYTGSPLTLTVLTNPLMGHITATYSVRTTKASAFASRFDFNIYSYYSDLSLGCELWRNPASNNRASRRSNTVSVSSSDAHAGSKEFKASRKEKAQPVPESLTLLEQPPSPMEREKAQLQDQEKDPQQDDSTNDDIFISAVKASSSFGMKTLKVLCEGRYKGFLISTGIGLNFAGEKPVTTNIGLELQFSS